MKKGRVPSRMRKLTMVQKSCGWSQAYIMIAEMYGSDQADKMLSIASKSYDDYQERYKQETGIRRGHIMGAAAIAALYIPLSELIGKEEAVSFMAEAMKPVSIAKHKKIERFPAPLFMIMAGVITERVFGEKAGFKRKWHCNTNREKKYDLLTCPYVETFNELGCPEVCPAVCIQDDISFGSMKNGVAFERKGTLGRGDECCDFCFRIAPK